MSRGVGNAGYAVDCAADGEYALKRLGLGLSIVAWIVKVHRGNIHVDSKPRQGTAFSVVLPSGMKAAAVR